MLVWFHEGWGTGGPICSSYFYVVSQPFSPHHLKLASVSWKVAKVEIKGENMVCGESIIAFMCLNLGVTYIISAQTPLIGTIHMALPKC